MAFWSFRVNFSVVVPAVTENSPTIVACGVSLTECVSVIERTRMIVTGLVSRSEFQHTYKLNKVP